MTRNGVRDELYETPLTIQAARRSAMRKLYPSANTFPPQPQPQTATAAAPFARTTPALGTPEREKLDTLDKSASESLEAIWKQERELDAEIAKSKRYTKKYDALEAKRQKLRDNEASLSTAAKPVHARHYRALLEDAAEQTANPVLSAAARLGIQEQDADKPGAYDRKAHDAYQQAYKDTQTGIERQLAERVAGLDAADTHESTKALLAALTPDEQQAAIQDAVHDAATSFLQHPLTAGDDIDKRLGGALYGARMTILRRNATVKIDGSLKQYQEALNILSGGDREFRQFKTTVEQTADPERIQEAVKDAENAVLAALQQRRLEDEGRAKVARELAQALRPVNDLPMPKINEKGLWGGNMLAEGDLVSDGHMMFDTRFVEDKKRLAPLRKRGDSSKVIPQDKVREAFDKAIAQATHPLQELGQAEHGVKSGAMAYAFLVDDQDHIYPFSARFIRWARGLTGADEVRGFAPDKPVVLYRLGQPVAMLIGVREAPEIDLAAARANAGIRGSVRKPGDNAANVEKIQLPSESPAQQSSAALHITGHDLHVDVADRLRQVLATDHPSPGDLMALKDAIVKTEGNNSEKHGIKMGLYPVWAAEKADRLITEGRGASQVPEAPTGIHLDTDFVGGIVDDLAAQIGQQPKSKPAEAPHSFKYELKVHGEGDKWHPLGTSYATREEAEKAGQNHLDRWMMATDVRVVESDEPPTYRWDDKEGTVSLTRYTPPAPVPPRAQTAEEKLTEAADQALRELKEGPQFERGERQPARREQPSTGSPGRGQELPGRSGEREGPQAQSGRGIRSAEEGQGKPRSRPGEVTPEEEPPQFEREPGYSASMQGTLATWVSTKPA